MGVSFVLRYSRLLEMKLPLQAAVEIKSLNYFDNTDHVAAFLSRSGFFVLSTPESGFVTYC